MIQEIGFHIDKLDSMKKYPKNIYYIGNTDLLQERTISIVGTRKPSGYTKQYSMLLHIMQQEVPIPLQLLGQVWIYAIHLSIKNLSKVLKQMVWY